MSRNPHYPAPGIPINAGDTFDTAHEAGCIALTDWAEDGSFEGIDSEGVRCMFHADQVTRVTA